MKNEPATGFEGPASAAAESAGGSGAERALFDASPRIDEQEFRRFLDYAAGLENGESLSLRPWLHIAEAWRITQALRQCRGNRSAAARALGIGRRTLYAKMEKLGITASWGV